MNDEQADCHKLYGKVKICNQYQNIQFITPPINKKEIAFTDKEREQIKSQKDRIDEINAEYEEDEDDDNNKYESFKDPDKCNDIYNEFTDKCAKMTFDASVLNAFKKRKKKNEYKTNPYGSRLPVRRGVINTLREIPQRRISISESPQRRISISESPQRRRISLKMSESPQRRRISLKMGKSMTGKYIRSKSSIRRTLKRTKPKQRIKTT